MSKLKSQKYVNLTSAECHAVVSMFSLYDYECTGYIPSYLAQKLISTLGKLQFQSYILKLVLKFDYLLFRFWFRSTHYKV